MFPKSSATNSISIWTTKHLVFLFVSFLFGFCSCNFCCKKINLINAIRNRCTFPFLSQQGVLSKRRIWNLVRVTSHLVWRWCVVIIVVYLLEERKKKKSIPLNVVGITRKMMRRSLNKYIYFLVFVIDFSILCFACARDQYVIHIIVGCGLK